MDRLNRVRKAILVLKKRHKAELDILRREKKRLEMQQHRQRARSPDGLDWDEEAEAEAIRQADADRAGDNPFEN